MLDSIFLDHIKHIKLCSEHLSKSHGIVCRVGRRRCKVRGKEKPLDPKSLRRYGLNVRANSKGWPACRPENLLRDGPYDSPLEPASTMRPQDDHGRPARISQFRNDAFRIAF